MNSSVRHILLVEDNPGDVRLIEESLRAHDIPYRLTCCDAVDVAVQTVSSYREGDSEIPDLVLLDYNLPRGESRAVLTAAMNNPVLTRIPKAVVTSSLAPRDREDALRNGADCFIYKPADLDTFLNEVGSKIAQLLKIE